MPIRATSMTKEEAVPIVMSVEKKILGVTGMNSMTGILMTGGAVNSAGPTARAISTANLAIGAPEDNLFFSNPYTGTFSGIQRYIEGTGDS